MSVSWVVEEEVGGNSAAVIVIAYAGHPSPLSIFARERTSAFLWPAFHAGSGGTRTFGRLTRQTFQTAVVVVVAAAAAVAAK